MDSLVAKIIRYRSIADFTAAKARGDRGIVEFKTSRVGREEDLAFGGDESSDPTKQIWVVAIDGE